jgi:phospholipid/cholesterol/gamma-HCH transport system permease protein
MLGDARLQKLGRGVLRRSAELVQIATLPYSAAKGAIVERGRGWRLVTRTAAAQVYYTGVEPLPLFCVIGVICGLFTVGLADALLRRTGLGAEVAPVVAIATVREVVPIVLGLILVGRSGTAIATELGYMRVNHEVDALDAVGINIDYYLVLPRILGVTLATVGLCVVVSGTALVGGFLAAELLTLVSVALHLSAVLESVTPATMVYALLKACVFGVVISAVNCFHGLAVGSSYTEIPRANVRGAVACYIVCFALNAVISIHALPAGL